MTPEPPRRDPNDAISGLIPYRNASALTAYYLGLFAILPVVGLGLGIAALVLGIRGLQQAREFPESKGKAHAGIGIGCGALGLLFNLLIVAGVVFALVGRR
jgi:hypothetical protein